MRKSIGVLPFKNIQVDVVLFYHNWYNDIVRYDVFITMVCDPVT